MTWNNIHVIFTAGEDLEALRDISRNYSGFVNNAYQIFFEIWSFESLKEVSTFYLQSQEFHPETYAMIHQDILELSS